VTSITTARCKQLKPILERALELAVDQRAEFVARAAGDDVVLRRELEALLEGAERAAFLDRWPERVPSVDPSGVRFEATTTHKVGGVVPAAQ